MDLELFVNKLEKLVETIDNTTEIVENNITDGKEKMEILIKELTKLFPEWSYFIRQTQIGNEEDIINILKDINQGMAATDSILLSDALEFGLKSLAVEYINIIKEALDEE